MSNSTAPWRFVRFDETEVEQVPGRSHHWYFKPGMVKDTNFLFVRCVVQPGQGHNFHFHPKMEEILYILEGSAEQWVEKEKRTIKAGESFYVPAGVVHATFNVSNAPLEFLAILSPASTGEPVTIEVMDQEPWKSLRK